MIKCIKIRYTYFSFRVVLARTPAGASGIWPPTGQQKTCKECCTYHKETIMMHLLQLYLRKEYPQASKLCWHYSKRA